MPAEGQSDRVVSDMGVRIKQRGVIEFSMQEKTEKNCAQWHPFILAKYLQRTISGCEHSEAVGVWCVSMGQQWYERQAMFQMTMHRSNTMKWSASLSSSIQIGISQPWNGVQSWISAPVHWKQWLQSWNIAVFATGVSHKCSHRNRKGNVCKFVRTYWIRMRLKVTVSWTVSLLVIRHGVIKMVVRGVVTCEFPTEKMFKKQPSSD